MVRLVAILATGLAALAGCGAPAGPGPGSPPPDGDRVGTIRVERSAGPDGERLTVRVRARDGAEPAVAELRGVWLDSGDGGRTWPIVGWADGPGGMVARCDGPPDHDLRILVRAVGDRRLHVTVEDRVGVRVALAGLGVAWHLLGADPADGGPDGGAPADEVVAPLPHPDADEVAGDVAFRAPIGYVRRGPLALAVLPDLAALARERRLPSALRIETGPGGPAVLHAIAAVRAEVGAHAARTMIDGARAVRVRDEVVRVEHELAAFADARPTRTVAALRTELWQRTVSPQLDRSSAPLLERTWDEIALPAVRQRLARDLRVERRGDVDTAFLLDPDASTDEVTIARLGKRDNLLRDAVAAARIAARVGASTDVPGAAPDEAADAGPDLRSAALQLARFALFAPRRGGMTPHTYRLGLDDGQLEWIPGDPDGPRPDAFDAADSAATAVLLLELADLLPELREPVHDVTSRLARFLRSSQRADGALAGVYDRQHLAPVWLDQDAEAGATAGPALFLARFAEVERDRDALDAAVRAVRFVHERAIVGDGPLVDPSLFRAAFRDARTGAPVRDLTPAAAVARAAITIETVEPTLGPALVTDLLDAVIELQQVWTPPWMRAALTGGFGGSNADATWNASSQTSAARAMFDGYVLLGDPQLLERGAAALRSALVEPRPFLPGGSRDSDPLPALAAAAALAEHVRSRLGQAVVDLDRGSALGLDAIWFERVTIGADRARFRSTTSAPGLDRADLRVVAATAVRPQLRDGESTLPVEERRAVVRPHHVPIFEFRPTASIAAGQDWRPGARVIGPLPSGSETTVEITAGVEVVARLPLSASATPGRMVAIQAFRPADSLLGETLHTRLVHEGGNRRVVVPADGDREVRVADVACIDPGDDDEATLVDSTLGTRIARFVDGRENAREADASGSFAYSVPVPREAAVIELKIVSSGALVISAGPDGRAVHEDLETVPSGDRVIPLRLADPRLWPDGQLLLRFRPVAASAAVARIEFRASGVAERAEAGTPRELSAPDLRIDLLVLPIELAGASAPQVELLRQALIGSSDYRVTPAPHPQPTAGSLASWVNVVSGGRTALTAEILDPWRADAPLAAVREADGWHTILDELAAVLSTAMQSRTTTFDAVLVVHGGYALDAPVDLAIGSTPLIVLPEREADGSYLSLGRLARSTLMRLRGLEDLGSPSAGAFGSLALTASADSHTPPAPVGVNLVRTGWASVVDVDPGAPTRRLRLPPVLEGRTVLRVATPEFAHAGELFVESRRTTSPALDEPDLVAAGLLVYRRYPPDEAPVIRLLDGRTIRPTIWRLSRVTPSLRTPFVRATSADLFSDTSRLDDHGSPSLATPRGETPWTIDRLDLVAGGTAALDLRWRGVDLLRSVERGWTGGSGGQAGPLVEGAPDAGAGRVLIDERGSTLLPANRDGALVQGVFEDPASSTPRRLYIEIEDAIGGRAALDVGRDGASLATVELPAGETSLTVDLPSAPRTGRLTIGLRRIDGAPSARVVDLLLVPRSANARSIAISNLPTATARLSDGSFHADATELRLDERGIARIRVPILAPTTRGALRIVCATDYRAGSPCTLRVDLLGANAEPPIALHDALRIDGASDRDVPVTVALCELPPGEAGALQFLMIEARGAPHAVLHLVALELDQP